MKVFFKFATVIISGLDLHVRTRRLDPNDVKIVPLLNPVMEVTQVRNGRPIQVMLTDTKSFPPIVEEDLTELRNHIVDAWGEIAISVESGAGFQVIEQSTQDFLNSYYKEEIQQVLEEAEIAPIVPPTTPLFEGETGGIL